MLRAGINDKLYLNTATFSSPTWTLINTVEDVDLGMEWSMAEVKSRVMLLVGHLPAMLSAPLTFGLLPETALLAPTAPASSVTGTFLATLRAAFYLQSIEQFAVADGPIGTAGTVWWTLEYYIAKTPLSQKLEAHSDLQVECQPAYSPNNVAIGNLVAGGLGYGFSIT